MTSRFDSFIKSSGDNVEIHIILTKVIIPMKINHGEHDK